MNGKGCQKIKRGPPICPKASYLSRVFGLVHALVAQQRLVMKQEVGESCWLWAGSVI